MVKTRSSSGATLREKRSDDSSLNGQSKSESVEKTRKDYPCNQKVPCCAENPCDRVLSTKSALRKHLRLMHGWSPDDLEKMKKRKICKPEKSCSNSPDSGSSLNGQPKSESVEKTGKNFPSKQKMPCCAENPCDKVLFTKSALIKHLKLLHGWCPDDIEKLKKKKICKSEKSCHNCGAKVANSSNLSRHLKHYCPKLFTITEKIHKCSVCEEGFDFSEDLKQHMISVHKSQSLFWCAYCRISCTSADKLRLHVLVHLRKDK